MKWDWFLDSENYYTYNTRRQCKCKERISITKKGKINNRRDGKLLLYPHPLYIMVFSKTFQIKYAMKLSPLAKLLLNSFQNKYLYYAIDDILYSLQSNPIEQENLLSILYSPIISLQNNLSINFFDIWIHEIYINEVSKMNKFLTNNIQTFESSNYITIKFLYKPPLPIKKKKILW